MDHRALDDLIETMNQTARRAPEVRVGIVIDNSPLTVNLGGATGTASSLLATRLTSYTPTILDRVLVLKWGNDVCVLGEIA